LKRNSACSPATSENISGNNWRQFDCLPQIVDSTNLTIIEQSSFCNATQSQKLHYFTQNNCDKNPFQNVRHPYCSMCAHGTANWNIRVLNFKMNKSYLSGRDLYNFLNNNINEIEAHTENEPKTGDSMFQKMLIIPYSSRHIKCDL